MNFIIPRRLLLLLAFLLPHAVDAGVLKGRVLDTRGEELPFATIFIQGTTSGTSANAEGNYQLSLAPGTYKIVSQYMGFRQEVFEVTIRGEETIEHNFRLQDQAMEMKAVTIKANSEDPAYGIIRKTIARRSHHLNQIKTFQTRAYLKGVLRNRAMPDKIPGVLGGSSGDTKAESAQEMGLDTSGKGILYLVEEMMEFYAQGSRQKTVVKSVRTSGNPQGLGASRLPPVISFYENNINIFSGVNPRGFVSPISENALHYYHYKYEGEFREDGYVIDKIKVTPKRQYEPLFQGTIYIAEEDWSIHSLDMTVTQKSNLEFLDTIHIQQTYLPLRKDTWVIKSQVFYPTIKILGFDVAGYFLTVYDDQKVNEPLPDSLFDTNIISSYDSMANKRDTSYWTQNRPLPLEQDEVQDYTVKDSLNAKLDDPAYRDSMRRKYNAAGPLKLISGGVFYNSKGYRHQIRSNSLMHFSDGILSYNTVEGVVVSPKLWWTHSMKNADKLKGALATRYGFSNTHFNAIGRISYTDNDKAWRERYWELGAEGGKYVFQINPQGILPIYNSFSTLFFKQNYLKLYERWTGSLFFERNFGNGLRWDMKASFQRRLLLQNTTGFNWAGKEAEAMSDNYPDVSGAYPWEPHNALLLKIGLSYRPGTKYVQYPDFKQPIGSDWPLFRLGYEKGISGVLDSKSDFDKWYFGVEDDIGLKLMGTVAYNLSIGGFINDRYVGLPDLKHLGGNQLIIAAPYLRSFQLAPYYQYSNTAKLYGQLHLEYYLKGLLTNKIPLFRQAKWYLVLGTNSFYAGENNYYTEAFAGIDNLGYKWFRFLRVDFVKSWDHYKRSASGIRIGLNLGSFISVSSGDNGQHDW